MYEVQFLLPVLLHESRVSVQSQTCGRSIFIMPSTLCTPNELDEMVVGGENPKTAYAWSRGAHNAQSLNENSIIKVIITRQNVSSGRVTHPCLEYHFVVDAS